MNATGSAGLLAALSVVPKLGHSGVILAVGVLVLALAVGTMLIITALKGRTDLTIKVSFGKVASDPASYEAPCRRGGPQSFHSPD